MLKILTRYEGVQRLGDVRMWQSVGYCELELHDNANCCLPGYRSVALLSVFIARGAAEWTPMYLMNPHAGAVPKQEQTFLWCRECISLSCITLRCAVTELHSIHLSMPHFPVLKKSGISQTLHPFFWRGLRFEQQGAVPWKICCSLSFSISLALSYSHCHSFSFSSPSVATCTSCLCKKNQKKSAESIWVLSYVGPGSVTAWPKEACSFPWTLPLQSGRVDLGSALIDNVSREGVATTVGFLYSERFCQSNPPYTRHQ